MCSTQTRIAVVSKEASSTDSVKRHPKYVCVCVCVCIVAPIILSYPLPLPPTGVLMVPKDSNTEFRVIESV